MKVLKENYANFNGRARRSEFWYFMLVNFIVLAVFNILAGVLGSMSSTLATILGLVGLVYNLAVIVPSIAVGVRRLHDTGKTGWMYLLMLVPIANFYCLYLMTIDSDAGDNEYGPNPKMIGA